MKGRIESAHILGYADHQNSFQLHTDASGLGLGAVLYQEHEGPQQVIEYASRGLTKADRRCPTNKMKFLALTLAVTDKFHDYLYGHPFRVVTYNNPLTYVLTTPKLDSTGHRWLSSLAAYDFDITYRTGKNNADADTLLSLLKPDEGTVISKDSIKAICGVISTLYVDTLAVTPDVLDTVNIDMYMQIEDNIVWLH